MILSKHEIIALLQKIKKSYPNDSEISETCDSFVNCIRPKNFSYEVEADCFDFYSGSLKDDFFIKNVNYFVKNDPLFPYSNVVKIDYSSKNKTLKFEMLDRSTITKKASEVDFSLKTNGNDFFSFLM